MPGLRLSGLLWPWGRRLIRTVFFFVPLKIKFEITGIARIPACGIKPYDRSILSLDTYHRSHVGIRAIPVNKPFNCVNLLFAAVPTTIKQAHMMRLLV